MNPIYLDYAATTPMAPEVLETMLPYFTEYYGNPSSLHGYGQVAKDGIERARQTIAAFIHAKENEIVFTGSGTESDNTVIKGVAHALAAKGNHIITSAIEHHAIHESLHFLEKQGLQVTYLPVDEYGLVDPDAVKKAITDKTILVSIMHANNEIGTIEPIAAIGAVAHEKGVLFHTDAVQTFGHIPIDVDALNIDLLSASAHKLYGPKGVGLLYIRKGTRITPLLHGGDQEKHRRASTQNVAGIVGFGRAVELAASEMESEAARQSALRDRLIAGLLAAIPDSRLNGHPEKRLPNNVNISIAYIEGEAMLLNLDMEGIAASTGSACTSSSLEPSHCLIAIGLPHELAHGSLRFTLGRGTTETEIDTVVAVLPGIVGKLRAMSPLYKKVAL
ncbi:MAG: cysteine desulfurase NifS [Syntrophaceae bacterium]